MSLRTSLALVDRLFDKRRGWVRYVFLTTAFSYTLSIAALGLAVICGAAEADETNLDQADLDIVGLLVIAPLMENLVFVLLVEFVSLFPVREWLIVLLVATLSAAAHAAAADWRAVSGFVGFAVMSYTYLLWKEKTFGQRYWITVAQHVLYNTPGAVAITLFQLA